MLKTFVLFGSLALCLFPETVQSRCPTSRVDCSGNDLMAYERIPNARRCAILCQWDRACVFWTYWKTRKEACFLKYACDNRKPDTRLITGYHKCIPRY